MCATINDYVTKITALEEEICSWKEFEEELKSEMKANKFKLSNISGLFKRQRKEKLEKSIEDNQDGLDACRDYISEKEVELQQCKQKLEELKKSLPQADLHFSPDVELTPDVIKRITDAAYTAVNGTPQEKLPDFVVVPRIDVSDM